jgi:signal transduction histidine kinase
MLQSQNLLEMVLVLASSVVFICGVFVITVLETHKTAGAAFKLRRHLDQIRQGQYHTRIQLRHDDNLIDLAESFNSMARSLENGVWQEVEALERFAARAEMLTGPNDASDLGQDLRTRADRLRQLIG